MDSRRARSTPSRRSRPGQRARAVVAANLDARQAAQARQDRGVAAAEHREAKPGGGGQGLHHFFEDECPLVGVDGPHVGDVADRPRGGGRRRLGRSTAGAITCCRLGSSRPKDPRGGRAETRTDRRPHPRPRATRRRRRAGGPGSLRNRPVHRETSPAAIEVAAVVAEALPRAAPRDAGAGRRARSRGPRPRAEVGARGAAQGLEGQARDPSRGCRRRRRGRARSDGYGTQRSTRATGSRGGPASRPGRASHRVSSSSRTLGRVG